MTTPLYTTDDGQPIVTHSMIKSFRRCPRQALYKYKDRLQPKALSKPLRRGQWIHSLLETHYKGGDWRKTHEALSARFEELFEDEKEHLGDLPREIKALMLSYFWHYRDDADWTVLETEFTFETEFPDGTLYRCRVDNLVETPYGLYLVDHKSHRSLPDEAFRMLDTQSPLYIWCARRNKIDVRGFIWNYIKTTGPKQLRFKIKDGGIYANQGETDYPTAMRSIKKADKDPNDYRDFLLRLKKQRYQHGAPQISPFFRRDWMDKNDDMVRRTVREAYHTAQRANRYRFDRRDYVERVPDRSCGFACGYRDLCTAELINGDGTLAKRSGYNVVDALDYYTDHEDEVRNNT